MKPCPGRRSTRIRTAIPTANARPTVNEAIEIRQQAAGGGVADPVAAVEHQQGAEPGRHRDLVRQRRRAHQDLPSGPVEEHQKRREQSEPGAEATRAVRVEEAGDQALEGDRDQCQRRVRLGAEDREGEVVDDQAAGDQVAERRPQQVLDGPVAALQQVAPLVDREGPVAGPDEGEEHGDDHPSGQDEPCEPRIASHDRSSADGFGGQPLGDRAFRHRTVRAPDGRAPA